MPRSFLLPLLLGVLLTAGCLSASPGPRAITAAQPIQAGAQPAIELATDAGAITILLYPGAAPRTVALMQQYVTEGYYVGRTFTRTVPGHVIQVSDPAGGATDDSRRVPLEPNATYHFSAGAVGTARDVDPNSGGPEFFIMDYATSHLDGNYTVWGQVVAGLDVVHDIATRPALDSSTVPNLGAPVGLPFDRMALVPVRITGAHLANLPLTTERAAQLPLVVAHDVRAGDLRHSLEWPRDLQVGTPSLLTWYVRPYGNAALPAGEVTIRDESGPLAMGGVRPGIYPFTWTPRSGGTHHLSFIAGGDVLTSLEVQVTPAQ